mmetsp:Transcript_9709/g.40742  ORF Transcript_9709/g.40742 Transcript_9709/m.40742 type:complete len:222 (+) Transcript_9709:103-768(+)
MRLFEPRASISSNEPILRNVSRVVVGPKCALSRAEPSGATSRSVAASSAKLLNAACAPVGTPRAHRHANTDARRRSPTNWRTANARLFPRQNTPMRSRKEVSLLMSATFFFSPSRTFASPARPTRARVSIGSSGSRSRPTFARGNARRESCTAVFSRSWLGNAPFLPSGRTATTSTAAPAGISITYACCSAPARANADASPRAPLFFDASRLLSLAAFSSP